MLEPDSDVENFSRLVDALRPWLGKVIFIGGWAHRLYRERPESTSPPYEALRTEDADVALDPSAIVRPEDLRGRLMARGFTEQMSGDAQPPVTHYYLGQEDAGFYAEFLTLLRGGERRRDGSTDVTERVGGIVAQKLRHLDVLLMAPWVVTVSDANGFALQEAAVVQIPNPVSFIAQKLLIHSRRKREGARIRRCLVGVSVHAPPRTRSSGAAPNSGLGTSRSSRIRGVLCSRSPGAGCAPASHVALSRSDTRTNVPGGRRGENRRFGRESGRPDCG